MSFSHHQSAHHSRANSTAPSHTSSTSHHHGLGLMANLSRQSSASQRQIREREEAHRNQSKLLSEYSSSHHTQQQRRNSSSHISPTTRTNTGSPFHFPERLQSEDNNFGSENRTKNPTLNALLAQQQQDLRRASISSFPSISKVSSGSPTNSASGGNSKKSSNSKQSVSILNNNSVSNNSNISNSHQNNNTSSSPSPSSILKQQSSFRESNLSKSNNHNKTNNSTITKNENQQQQQQQQPYRTWTDIRNASKDHVHAAAANSAWVAKTTRELQEAIRYVSEENGMMEEVLSEPHHIVSNNDLANIMKSVLSAASDSKSSSIMQNRKPPVLRCLAKAKQGASLVASSNSSNSNNEKNNTSNNNNKPTMNIVPLDRSGTEYLPFASSAVPYSALQQEQRDMIQRNKERQAAYDRMILDVERQQMSFQEQFAKL